MGVFSKLFGGESECEYYAVIDKSGLFYSGEIPDVKWSKVTLCSTYNELINKLSEKLREEQEKSITWNTRLSPKTSYEEMTAKYPGKQIISITPHGPGRQHSMQRYANDSYEYYAYIEQSGLFFSGEMPDINFSKVTLCKTAEEVINKLTEKLNEEYTKAGKRIDKMPQKTSYNQMIAHNPGKQVVSIRPTRF